MNNASYNLPATKSATLPTFPSFEYNNLYAPLSPQIAH